jgi:drug/metabolite transporter (DMT)-like permease
MSRPLSLVFALLGAFSQALTSVLQRLANVGGEHTKRSGWEQTKYLVRQPMWLAGMATMGGTFVFTAVALYLGELATVQPILVTELIFTLALRALWLHDRIAGRTWGAAAMLCAGLAGFLVVAHPREGIGRPSFAGWAVALSSRGLLILVLVILARWGSPARKAALLGASAGLMWAIDAAVVKTATEVLGHEGIVRLFLHWPVYGVVITGVLGTVLLEAAFTAGPLSASQSTLLIVDPLASIAIGIELFHEKLNNSPAAISAEVLFLVVMFTGVVLLSLWAPPSMEARGRRSPRPVAVGSAVAGAVTTSPASSTVAKTP